MSMYKGPGPEVPEGTREDPCVLGAGSAQNKVRHSVEWRKSSVSRTRVKPKKP